MKIYTKTGDKGTTRLVDGSCVEKFNPRVEAYGTVDELNSCVGVLVSLLQSNELPMKTSTSEIAAYQTLSVDLLKIQHWLFNAGSLLATEKSEVRSQLPPISENHIQFLEEKIDQMTASLPVLKHFILPGGNLRSSQAHMCRTICRRAERRSAEVILPEAKNLEDPVLIFLNRLSDYFFTLARYLNILAGQTEITWNKDQHG